MRAKEREKRTLRDYFPFSKDLKREIYILCDITSKAHCKPTNKHYEAMKMFRNRQQSAPNFIDGNEKQINM